MRRNNARVQILALLLLGVFGVLSLDLAPVRAVLGGLLPRVAVADESGETSRGPLLVGRRFPPARREAGSDGGGAAPALACDEAVAAAHEARVQRAEASGTAQEITTALVTSLWPTARPTLRSLPQAVILLGLDPQQASEWERILADARQDLDDLRYVTDEKGRSWHGVVAEHGARCARNHALLQGLADFVHAELSGGETYFGARARILAGYRAHLRAQLGAEQQRLFDAHDASALLDDAAAMAALQQGTWRTVGLLAPA